MAIKEFNLCSFILTDSCKKTGIVFDDVVSSLEFVNCQSMQGQVIALFSLFNVYVSFSDMLEIVVA